MILIAADGWFDACFILVWQIALFVSLGESIAAYGGAMALAGLAGAVAGLLLGRRIDAGHGRQAVAIAYGVAAVIVLLRAASLGSPWLAVGANALGGFFWPLLGPALGAAVYNLAKASPCPFRFHMATEGGWDIGCFAACLLAGGAPGLGRAAFAHSASCASGDRRGDAPPAASLSEAGITVALIPAVETASMMVVSLPVRGRASRGVVCVGRGVALHGGSQPSWGSPGEDRRHSRRPP